MPNSLDALHHNKTVLIDSIACFCEVRYGVYLTFALALFGWSGSGIACQVETAPPRIEAVPANASPLPQKPEASQSKQVWSSESFYEKNRVIDVVIEIDPEQWNQLAKQNRDIGKAFAGEATNPFTWFQASVSIDGTKVDSVGIRKKGFIGSLDHVSPSLKIDFERYKQQSPIDDVDVLTLNNNKQDESLLSQTIAYRIFDAAEVAAPRCNFAKVTVNGNYLGLYTNVEGIEKGFLKRQFGSSHGDLYEGTITDFYPRTIGKIEVKNNKKRLERPRLAELASLLAVEDDLDLERVRGIVDVDNFLKYWATESLLAFWDGYANNQNNYWFYDDPKTGKWRFIPWGADMTMEASRGMPQFGPQGPVSIYAQSYLANRLIHHSEISDQYRATMVDLLERVWDEELLLKQIDELEEIIKPHLGVRQKNAGAAIDRLRTFVKTRKTKIERELKEWPVRFPDRPRKPTYALEFGTFQGKFSTAFSDKMLHGPSDGSELSVALTLHGEPAVFHGKGASIFERTNSMGRFGPPMPSAPKMELLLTGVQEIGNVATRMILSIDKAEYTEAVDQLVADGANEGKASQTKPIEIDGMYFEGNTGPGFMPFGGKSARGVLILDRADAKAGGVVSGSVDLKLIQIKGGFFDRPQPRPGTGNPDGATRRPPMSGE